MREAEQGFPKAQKRNHQDILKEVEDNTDTAGYGLVAAKDPREQQSHERVGCNLRP